ncbi:hypothetical protein L4X63_19530 [Geomonas sp. Red32]|uniref:hypothetical protein n=1 Tax=Geomonas sp. Red32 TaxID=2912856 RepID=UPI00202CCA38|nr:hypothetical protein [Geomonas sp. Red32]MCM0083783.1 hypothetical protein [Geomonas sp. Red32]
MKKLAMIGLLAGALLAHAHPSEAHIRGGVYFGPMWGPWWWGPPVVVQQEPVIIREEPPIYIQQQPQPEPQQYWYYCSDPNGYYPYVKKCPKGWMRVAPTPAPPDEEE